MSVMIAEDKHISVGKMDLVKERDLPKSLKIRLALSFYMDQKVTPISAIASHTYMRFFYMLLQL